MFITVHELVGQLSLPLLPARLTSMSVVSSAHLGWLLSRVWGLAGLRVLWNGLGQVTWSLSTLSLLSQEAVLDLLYGNGMIQACRPLEAAVQNQNNTSSAEFHWLGFEGWEETPPLD